ncbi:hypothetical protein EDB81DRAFT_934292 [Dactylonectria macrodidyma]|uniref:Nephrocystin 3-like N-terminal domain-containing protein n=1 Tax=Dactylonectria macrodidyma TaxID=307937 RepID=A0A9P9J8L3_9HYPO|nr:hypothetical protein EDB81DRAFT_934292 [Dactylonectria macrodidyma]
MEVAASLVAFIEVTAKVIRHCKDYIEHVKDAPHVLRTMLVEISSLKCALENIQFLLEVDPSSQVILNLGCAGGVLDTCKQALTRLESLLPERSLEVPVPGSHIRGKKRQLIYHAFTAAAWLPKQEKALQVLREISKHKATITLALVTDSSRDIKLLETEVKAVQDVVTGSERRQFYEWLEVTNPSSLHLKAYGLHEDETGVWVLNLQSWKNWVATTQCLWIHGIPGAGKTILASFLSDTITKISGSTDRVASIYYYCYFGHDQDETIPILGWVVSQLCRRGGERPQQLLSIYEKGVHPSREELLDSLADILDSFAHIYVVIDALDESKEPRTGLLHTLSSMLTEHRFRKIQLLITSRELFEIKLVLSDVVVPVEMQVNMLQADIRKHVRSALSKNHRFSTWPEELRRDVQDTLAVRAKGMFRWVVCQMDILRRLRTVADIKKALQDLPEGLDETYERIFDMIPNCDRALVKRTLSLLCANDTFSIDNSPMTPHLLVSLVTEDWHGASSEASGDRLCDLDMLEDACGCLVTIGKGEWGNEQATLAHSTVKEFLFSERRTKSLSPACRFFALSSDTVDRTLLEATLPVILQYTGPFSMTSDGSEVYNYAGYHGFTVIERRFQNLKEWQLDSLAIQALDPQGQPFERVMINQCGNDEVRARLLKIFHALKNDSSEVP